MGTRRGPRRAPPRLPLRWGQCNVSFSRRVRETHECVGLRQPFDDKAHPPTRTTRAGCPRVGGAWKVTTRTEPPHFLAAPPGSLHTFPSCHLKIMSYFACDSLSVVGSPSKQPALWDGCLDHLPGCPGSSWGSWGVGVRRAPPAAGTA